MKYIEQYNNARREVESRFSGLPHAHGRLMQLLITRADPKTGLVENLCCRDLAMLLAVEHAPGRKGAGIPKIETIRSYLRTIAKSCASDFKLINQGQKLVCQFINLPNIYACFFAQKEVYGDRSDEVTIVNPLEKTDEFSDCGVLLGADNPVESPIEAKKKEPVKNIYIINKHNKQTGEKFEDKKLIADDFYPTAETIEEALNLGFVKVTDPSEIKAFISHNRQQKTRWANFNPVFLTWLARDFKPHSSTDAVNGNKQSNKPKTGRNHNERSTHQFNNNKPTLADLWKRNQEIIREYEGVTSNTVIEGEYCEVMVGAR